MDCSIENILYHTFYAAVEVKTMITLPIPIDSGDDRDSPIHDTTWMIGEEDGSYF
jgi:hypothetical protein